MSENNRKAKLKIRITLTMTIDGDLGVIAAHGHVLIQQSRC